MMNEQELSSLQPETEARFAQMTDEQVVELAGGGDEQALEYLLNKYKNLRA